MLRVAHGEEPRQLVADGLRGLGVPPAAGTVDDVHGQGRPDVAGDQRLLDLVPVRLAARAERAPQPGGEAGAGLLEAVLQLLALVLTAHGISLLRAPVRAPGPLASGLGLRRLLVLGRLVVPPL